MGILSIPIQSHNFQQAKEKHDLHQAPEKKGYDIKVPEDEDFKLDQKGKEIKDKLQDNSLFNQISGYAPTGGFVGSVVGFLSRQLDKLAGLSENSNDSYINSLLVCKKFYQDKDQNKTQ